MYDRCIPPSKLLALCLFETIISLKKVVVFHTCFISPVASIFDIPGLKLLPEMNEPVNAAQKKPTCRSGIRTTLKA